MDQATLYVFWWAVAGALFFLELITPATIFIFPAIIAVLIGFLALVVDNIFIQGTIFFVLSTLTVALIRPLLVTSNKDVGYRHGKYALIGKKVKVMETINNDKEHGRIKHASDVFPARSIQGVVIEKGQWVIIKSMEGITAMVSPVEE